MKPKFAFVLEQALGHRVYGARLESAIAEDPRFHPTVIRVEPHHSGAVAWVPGLRNHSLQTSWKARRALRCRTGRDQPDALFIHTQCAALMSSKTMRHVPTVVSLDATPVNYDSVGEAYRHRRQGRMAEWAKRQVYRSCFDSAAALTTWTAWAAASLVSDYGVRADKIEVIPPGVDLARFRPRDTRRDGPVRILFVGGDFKRKGGEDLLRAAALMRGRCELDIVTSGLPAGVNAPPGVRVHLGLKGDSEALVRLYRDADIFALPAYADCYPQAVAEASACGLPVVATRVGAVAELVIHGENGLLVEPGSASELAGALQTLVDAPALRVGMGHQGRELTIRHNDFQRNYGAIVAMLQRVSRGSS